jgi:hypothetical protein
MDITIEIYQLLTLMRMQFFKFDFLRRAITRK